MSMALCCPPGHGCNAPGGDEPCALALCRAAAVDEDDAALALSRWGDFEAASEQGERRFRRRAFERARDRALIGLAMTRGPWVGPGRAYRLDDQEGLEATADAPGPGLAHRSQ